MKSFIENQAIPFVLIGLMFVAGAYQFFSTLAGY